MKDFKVEVSCRAVLRVSYKAKASYSGAEEERWQRIYAADVQLSAPVEDNGGFTAFLQAKGGGSVFVVVTSQEAYATLERALARATELAKPTEIFTP